MEMRTIIGMIIMLVALGLLVYIAFLSRDLFVSLIEWFKGIVGL